MAKNPGPMPGDSWHVECLVDAYKPQPPVVYAVDDVIPLPSLNVLFGAPGSLKTFVAADLLVCVAAGLPWLPAADASMPGMATKQLPAMLIDFDNGRRLTRERIAALARARNLPPDAPLYYVSMPIPILDATKHAHMKPLHDRIVHYGVKLVVIDNLGLITGKADENSAEIAEGMSNLRYLAESTGAAVIVIHHQRKNIGLKTRAGDSLRGHSSIEAAIDLALLVQREPRSSIVEVMATKVRGADVPPFGAAFSYEHRTGTKELHAARFWGISIDDSSSDSAVRDAIAGALLAQQPLTKTALKAAVKNQLPDVGENRIGWIIDEEVAAGRLVERPGSRNAKLYELP